MNTTICMWALGVWLVVCIINCSVMVSKCKGGILSSKCKDLHSNVAWQVWTCIACLVVCGLSGWAVFSEESGPPTRPRI